MAPHRQSNRYAKRTGAVIPLFAILLPVLLLLCTFAINMAYIQLTRAELQTATDAAALAGGRALSEFQSTAKGRQFAVAAAAANTVAGEPLRIRLSSSQDEIQFGSSVRNGNAGRFVFSERSDSSLSANTAPISAIRVKGRRDGGSLGSAVNLLMGGVGTTKRFNPISAAVCSQIDRDIVVIMDRSGSMFIHADTPAESYNGCRDWAEKKMKQYKADGGFNSRKGTWVDQNVKAKFLRLQRFYIEFCWKIYGVNKMPKGPNECGAVIGNVPIDCRWKAAVAGLNQMLDLFEESDQQELVSIVTFCHFSEIKFELTKDYDAIRQWAANANVGGATNLVIGPESAYQVFTGNTPRPFAQKTILYMTDGHASPNYDNPDALDSIVQDLVDINAQIHTLAVSREADSPTMEAIAESGTGKFFHPLTSQELIDAFAEVAVTSPSVITE